MKESHSNRHYSRLSQLGITVLVTSVIAGLIGFSLAREQAQKVDFRSKIKLDLSEVDREGGIAKSYAEIVDRVRPSVVSVSTLTALPDPYRNLPPSYRFFYGLPEQDSRRAVPGIGSGVIISEDGFILTNHHVVGNADVIKVKLFDGSDLEAKVIGSDPNTDVALIKVAADQKLSGIAVADSAKVRTGDVTLAFGSPFGLEQTVSMGIISATGRANVGITEFGNFLQTDASINPGNSGGALVDTDGRLIGINTAIFSKTGQNNGIGFAIPVNMALDIAAQLENGGKVARGYLGILMQDLSNEEAKQLGAAVSGTVLVSRVIEGSPAMRAGLQEGDLILKVNGEKVQNSFQLRALVASRGPGSEVDLEISRKGEATQLSVKLAGENELVFDDQSGVPRPVEDRDALEMIDGLVLEQVGDSSVAVRSIASANQILQPGDLILEINRVPVKSLKDAEEAMRLTGRNQGILVRASRVEGGRKVTFLVMIR